MLAIQGMLYVQAKLHCNAIYENLINFFYNGADCRNLDFFFFFAFATGLLTIFFFVTCLFIKFSWRCAFRVSDYTNYQVLPDLNR